MPNGSCWHTSYGTLMYVLFKHTFSQGTKLKNLSSYSLPEVDGLFKGTYICTVHYSMHVKEFLQQMIAVVQSAYLPAQNLTALSICHGFTNSVCQLQTNGY